MVDVTAEWGLVVVTIGLVFATATLAWFTRRLAVESRAFSDAMNGLAEQTRRQVEMSKLALRLEAEIRSHSPIKAIDEV